MSSIAISQGTLVVLMETHVAVVTGLWAEVNETHVEGRKCNRKRKNGG